MIDFNSVLEPGDYQNGQLNTIIEIPMGSSMKIEWDRKTGIFALDRVEPGIFAKPANYGFIPRTLDEDGDELDTLVVTHEPIPMGVLVKARILGVLNFDDDGEPDHKIVVVPEDDRHTGNKIKTLADLGERWQQQAEHHFTHYKDLYKPGSTKVLGWGDAAAAKQVIAESIARFESR